MEDPEVWRWIWLGAMGLFAVGEVFIAGSFFLLPFAAGALVACVVAFAGGAVTLQWLVFLAVSAVASAGLVPLRRRLDRTEPQNGVGSRRLIGQQAVVIVAVPAGPSSTGEVRLGREMWRAESAEQTAIAVDTIVQVLDVRGTSVVVQTVSPQSPTPEGIPS